MNLVIQCTTHVQSPIYQHKKIPVPYSTNFWVSLGREPKDCIGALDQTSQLHRLNCLPRDIRTEPMLSCPSRPGLCTLCVHCGCSHNSMCLLTNATMFFLSTLTKIQLYKHNRLLLQYIFGTIRVFRYIYQSNGIRIQKKGNDCRGPCWGF